MGRRRSNISIGTRLQIEKVTISNVCFFFYLYLNEEENVIFKNWWMKQSYRRKCRDSGDKESRTCCEFGEVERVSQALEIFSHWLFVKFSNFKTNSCFTLFSVTALVTWRVWSLLFEYQKWMQNKTILQRLVRDPYSSKWALSVDFMGFAKPKVSGEFRILTKKILVYLKIKIIDWLSLFSL